ncbi:MAG: GtrA family protein [Bacilli bacterium]|nr:GtrA family protein [Bacilli bacterium]
MNKNMVNQIVKFLIVGGIATFLDYFIFYVSCNLLNIYPLLSNFLSFSISVIYNYLASVKWVFDVDGSKDKNQLFLKFMFFSIIGFLLTEIIIYIGIELVNMNEMMIKFIASLIVMIFNFVTRKMFLEN